MLSCHSCYICGTWRSNEEVWLKLSYGGKGKSHKQEEILWGTVKKLPRKLTTELLFLDLPTYFGLLRCKRIDALHKIPS